MSGSATDAALDGVAVIGLAGRFPGARGVDEFWRNLCNGVESISTFTDDELLASGIDPDLVRNPDYIKAKGVLGDIDLFDADFFRYSPRVAELMDPQHRVFLECAWEALENAGYDSGRYAGHVGVFAGESMNTYLLTNLITHLDLVASMESLQAAIGNDKDSLTTEVAYKLGLTGPAVTIQTSSSTSLAAVHVACQSLLTYESDMALAGGVSIHIPEISGYLYHEGGTTARDGHCRAFDARGQGFVSGHGVGIVVLKRLDDALADGDTIYAVIRGSAMNNDGANKVSYMAPSVNGQATVIALAHALARIEAESIGYVEAHGTGTAIGDPIEIAALTQAFRAGTQRQGFCAIGSVKTNIGHLDAAAGVAGLIKAVLSLKHRMIPPSLHFEQPNPQIDFAASPFYVNTTLAPWPDGLSPRRAGVSSFGMGGTNIHLVLEEAPAADPPSGSRPYQLLLLSAKTATALETITDRLTEALPEDTAASLADVAYTLQVGRQAMPVRRVVLCRERDDALAALRTRDPERLLTAVHPAERREVVFMFPGQGAQHVGMAAALYGAERTFRDHVDRCCTTLVPHLGLDLRAIMFPAEGQDREQLQARLEQTALAQPALFVIDYALAQLWMAWGSGREP